jgi:hypothetical protein
MIPCIIYSLRTHCEGEIFFKTSVRFKNAVEKSINSIFATEGIVSLFSNFSPPYTVQEFNEATNKKYLQRSSY